MNLSDRETIVSFPWRLASLRSNQTRARMFKKILIANRGEIALRAIRTAREMGIKTRGRVQHRRPREPRTCASLMKPFASGRRPARDSYLNMVRIIAAAEITNADAIHPGYGFPSENAKFSKLCQQHNISSSAQHPSDRGHGRQGHGQSHDEDRQCAVHPR